MYSGMFNIAYKNIGSNFNHWIVRVFLLAIIDRENIILLSKKGQDTHEGSSNPDANSKR